MKEDKYTKGLASNQVYAIIHLRNIWKSVLPKLYGFVWRRHVGVPLRGTKIAAENQRKHLDLSFPTYALIHRLRNS